MKKIALLLAGILLLSCSKKSEQNLATKSIEQLKIDSINEYRKKRNDSIAIKNAKNKGIEVVLCSGRGFASVKSIANETEANNYAVCGNGALVYNIKNQKIMYNNFIEKEKVLQIIQICEENSIYYSICTTQNIIAKSLNYNVLFYHQENEKKPDDQKTNINVVQDIYKYIKDREKEDYLKISICDEHNVIFNGIIRKLRTINKIDVFSYT